MNEAESGLYKWFAEGAEERKYLSIPRRGGMRQLLGIYYCIPLRVHFFLKCKPGWHRGFNVYSSPTALMLSGIFYFSMTARTLNTKWLMPFFQAKAGRIKKQEGKNALCLNPKADLAFMEVNIFQKPS